MEEERNINTINNSQLRIGEILSLSWKIYTQNIKDIIIIVLVIYVPFLIINELIPYDSIMINYGENGVKLTNNIYRLFRNLTRFLGLMAIIQITEGGVLGTKYTYQEALKISYSRWWAMIQTGFLGGFIVLGYMLLLIIPGIIRSIYYSFSMFIVTLRNLSGKAALDYSKTLIEGQWWRVLGYTVLFRAMGLGIGIILGLILLLIPDLVIIDLFVYTIAEIIDVLFIVAIAIFFINIDFTKDKNRDLTEQQNNAIKIDEASTP